MRVKPLVNTLSIDNELGRQSGARFTLVNVTSVPVVGQPVTIKWYSDTLFRGSIDRVRVQTNNATTFTTYDVECVDHSYLLFRRKLTKEWTNVQWATIAQEAQAEGFSYGTSNPLAVNAWLPIVSCKDGNVHDLLSETAASIGCTFYVDYDKKMHLVAASLPSAPETLDDTIVEVADVTYDRETYRNKQTVTITGTAAAGQTPATVTYTRQNSVQIAERAAVEGGNGIYNDLESITHPTSNVVADLQNLAVSYAKIRLGAKGGIRQWMTVRTRASGFRAGQVATVSLSQLGISGEWVIQKTSIREEAGRFMITTLELNRSTLLPRAQELWLDIVRKGQIVTMAPSPPPAPCGGLPPVVRTVNFTTPGTTNWVVPGGVVSVQFTIKGAGGGGGGGATSTVVVGGALYYNGGKGGNGGLAISVLDVTPGETLSIVVGAKGTKGTSASTAMPANAVGTNGATGGTSSVSRGATVLASATGGIGGSGAAIRWTGGYTGAGSPGGSGVGR